MIIGIDRFAIFLVLLLGIAACKKQQVLPNHDPRSKGKRIARSWTTNSPVKDFNSVRADNTRVVVAFYPKGEYDWVVYTRVLGVESSVSHHGHWRFIEQQKKLVLEESNKTITTRDTFIIQGLTSNRLNLQQQSFRTRQFSVFDFVAE